MADSGPNGTNSDLDIDLEIDIRMIADALKNNPAFIRALAILVRDDMTKGLARRNSNIFGLTAQAPTVVTNPRGIS